MPLSRLLSRSNWDWGLGLAIVLVTAALYGRTLQPTLGGTWDSDELQHAAYTLGLAHPTGYPLFLILGKLWITLFPFGDIAFRMNWFSAVWALGTVVLTFSILRFLTKDRTASVLGTLVLATVTPFWTQAGMAQVGTFTTFLTGGLILCLLLWREGRVPLELCAFVYGLGLAHHRTFLFYAPGVLLFVALSQPGALRSGRLILRALALVLLPFVAYIYVPLRLETAPEMVPDLPSFFRYVIGTDVGRYLERDGTVIAQQRVDLIPELFRAWFSALGFALAFFGFWQWMVPRMRSVDNWAVKSLLSLTFVLVTLFTTAFGETERYLLVPAMIMAIAIGVGAARLAQVIRNLGRESRIVGIANAVIFVAFLGLPLRAVIVGFPVVDHSKDFRVYNFWSEALESPLEPGAIVIGYWSEINQVRYMQRVEGRRPDIETFEGEKPWLTAEIIRQKLPTGKAIYLTPQQQARAVGFQLAAFGPLYRVVGGP